MKIKTQYVIVFFCLLLIILPITNVQSKSTWYFTDGSDDVELYDNHVIQSTGDYHNEIDVERVELDGNYIVIHTQDKPIDDQDHYYEVYIYWHDYPFKVLELNYTRVEFGEGINHVYTQLYIDMLELTDDIYDEIYIEKKTIWCPIPLFNHIDNITAEYIGGETYYYLNKTEQDFYYDELQLETITWGSSGYTFAITIIGTVIVTAICLVKKKR